MDTYGMSSFPLTFSYFSRWAQPAPADSFEPARTVWAWLRLPLAWRFWRAMSRRVCGFPWSFGATGGVARRNPPGLLDSAEEHHGTPYPLVMTNSSPWFFDSPIRNRWFTVLKNGWIFHGYVKLPDGRCCSGEYYLGMRKQGSESSPPWFLKHVWSKDHRHGSDSSSPDLCFGKWCGDFHQPFQLVC